MTEAQAWREIAADIEKAGRSSGLCWELDKRGMGGGIDSALEAQMLVRLNSHLNEDGASYFTHYGSGPWLAEVGEVDVRILAAYFLALEAEDEAR